MHVRSVSVVIQVADRVRGEAVGRGHGPQGPFRKNLQGDSNVYRGQSTNSLFYLTRHFFF